jgi:DNA (cytosine-5)-methyltransferase 1
MSLILSLFPGIDLLGRGFELEGYCVVRGPDTLWGGDIRRFYAPANRFDGIIAGSPCQDFSRKRRAPPTGEGLELLREFGRVVFESQAAWFLLENVPTVPDIQIEGYTVQRFDLNSRECGAAQSRLRHFQFGSKEGLVISPHRRPPTGCAEAVCLASEGESTDRRSFADFCELQGLPRDFDLPGWSIAAKYCAVGNGVHVGVARVIARAIRDATCAPRGRRITDVRLCACNCGRILTGRQKAATAGCRKRLERERKLCLAGLSPLSSGHV